MLTTQPNCITDAVQVNARRNELEWIEQDQSSWHQSSLKSGGDCSGRRNNRENGQNICGTEVCVGELFHMNQFSDRLYYCIDCLHVYEKYRFRGGNRPPFYVLPEIHKIISFPKEYLLKIKYFKTYRREWEFYGAVLVSLRMCSPENIGIPQLQCCNFKGSSYFCFYLVLWVVVVKVCNNVSQKYVYLLIKKAKLTWEDFFMVSILRVV